MDQTYRTIKVTPESLEAYRKAADQSGLYVNGWIKSVLNLVAGGSVEKSVKIYKRKIFKHREKLELRSVGQSVVFPTEDWERYEAKAREANMTVFEWIRLLLDHAAGVSNIKKHVRD